MCIRDSPYAGPLIGLNTSMQRRREEGYMLGLDVDEIEKGESVNSRTSTCKAVTKMAGEMCIRDRAMAEVRRSLSRKGQPMTPLRKSLAAQHRTWMQAGMLFLGGESINTIGNVFSLARSGQWDAEEFKHIVLRTHIIFVRIRSRQQLDNEIA